MKINIHPDKKKVLLKVFQILLLSLILYFISLLIYKNWQQIINYQWSIKPKTLFSSFIVLLIPILIQAKAWSKLIGITGIELPLKTAYKINTISNLTKYIPGGFWDHVSKFALAKKYKLEGKRTFLSIILSIVLSVLTGIIIFFLSLLFFSKYTNLKFIPYFTILILLGFAAIYPPILQKILDFILPKLGKQKLKLSFTYTEILISSFWYFLSWIMVGSALFLLIRSLTFIDISLLPAIIGAYAISWVIGFLTPIAPNGAGVREVSLIFLLDTIIPRQVAIVSALSFRILIILRDLVSAVIGSRL